MTERLLCENCGQIPTEHAPNCTHDSALDQATKQRGRDAIAALRELLGWQPTTDERDRVDVDTNGRL